MRYNIFYSLLLSGLIVIFFDSCKKDDNPNNLPGVSPSDYEGKIDGYSNSDEINPKKLVAYWSFDDSKNELKTNTAPTQTANDALVDGGVRGKALSLTAGYLYFAKQFDIFKTDQLTSWSISIWVKVKNNGSKKTMLLQLPYKDSTITGSINFILNTNGYPATNDSVLRIAPVFRTIGGGTQDNLNSVLDKTNLNQWNHIVLTYDITTGVFNNWLNGVKVGNFPNRGTGNNLFKSYEPNELIIGSSYNGIPDKKPGSDATVAPMTGMIDELKIFNEPLKDDYIKALYKLGMQNK